MRTSQGKHTKNRENTKDKKQHYVIYRKGEQNAGGLNQSLEIAKASFALLKQNA